MEGGDRYGPSDLEPVLGDHGCRPCSPADIEQVGVDDEEAKPCELRESTPMTPMFAALPRLRT